MSDDLLVLIPARGGSKGVLRKNLRPLVGRTLIERTYAVVNASGLRARVVVSTDDPEIQAHALALGIEAPFLRPEELSGDRSPMIDVVLHALDYLKESDDWEPSAVMLLQPTSPLRRAEHLTQAMLLLEGHDSVCSVIPIPITFCPDYAMRIEADGRLDYFTELGRTIKRRQDVRPAYSREGTLYLTRASVLREYRDFYGPNCAALVLDPADSLSIDTAADWEQAELRLQGSED